MAHLLLFSVLAVLAGATSYRGIVTFLAIHRDRLGHDYGVRLRRAPAVNTLRNLFLALDPEEIEAACRRHARHLGAAARPDGPRAVALDGKTLRRSFDRLHDRAAAHVLGAFAADAALILGHQEVPDVPSRDGVAWLEVWRAPRAAFLTAEQVYVGWNRNRTTSATPGRGALTVQHWEVS